MLSFPSKNEKNNSDWSSVLIKTDLGDTKPTYFWPYCGYM